METDEDVREIEAPERGEPRLQHKPIPAWLRAERYFKRYRDTQKTIPLRPRTDGKANP